MTNDDIKKSGYVASLSNGETIFEQECSWNELVYRCETDNIKITQLRLQVFGVTMVTPKDAQGYKIERKTILTKKLKEKLVVGIGVLVDNKVYLSWIDESRNILLEIADADNAEFLYKR